MMGKHVYEIVCSRGSGVNDTVRTLCGARWVPGFWGYHLVSYINV